MVTTLAPLHTRCASHATNIIAVYALVADESAEHRGDRGADRSAKVGNAADIDADEAHGAERGERQQRQCA